ncbi:HipA family kinase [Exiguobacterium sp.]|uniref:HipA family kinase n=1 Tax=Exiguobacterium sp. TaxID=44751 RepID=UPI0028A67C4A|nr:HipA family kinase [Exiguobacterium sp.]
MIKRLHLEEILEPMDSGISVPHRVIADDGEQYILKTQKRFVPESKLHEYDDMMFFNELLCYQIAKYLNIPIPEAAIINVEKESIDINPRLYFAHKFEPGLHYASSYISDFESNIVQNHQVLMQMGKPHLIKTWNAFFDKIENPEIIADIFALDILVANFDRYSNFGNVQISYNKGSRKLYALDFGHAFYGPVWDAIQKQTLLNEILNPVNYHNTILSLKNRAPYSSAGSVFKALEKFVDLCNPIAHSFQEVVYKIEHIDEAMIETWFSNIPDIWFVDKVVQKEMIKQYLLNQKQNMRAMIQLFASNDAFTNYRGGELTWNIGAQVNSDTV